MANIQHKVPALKRITACFLLLIFLCSVTPKRYLHDFFADHKDTFSNLSFEGKLQLNQTGVHCDCDFLVTTSPFSASENALLIPSNKSYAVHIEELSASVYAAPELFYGLRGPPVLI